MIFEAASWAYIAPDAVAIGSDATSNSAEGDEFPSMVIAEAPSCFSIPT